MTVQTVLSVRGEASRTIAADHVTLQCASSTAARSKVDALAQLGGAQQRLIGAVAADPVRHVLTLSAHRHLARRH